MVHPRYRHRRPAPRQPAGRRVGLARYLVRSSRKSTMLSAEALALLRLHVERRGDVVVDDSNREAYRELAREGLMVPGHSFLKGREAFYRLTEIGWKFAKINGPWLEGSASRPSVGRSP